MPVSTQLTGIGIVATGVLIFSFDAALIRLAGVSGPDAAFWRGTFIALTFACMLTGRHLAGRCAARLLPRCAKIRILHSFLSCIACVASRQTLREVFYRAGGTLLLFAGLLYGSSTFFFTLAISHTTAANALIILSTIPLLCVVLSRIFLKEPVDRRTAVAIVCVFAGVWFIVADSLQTGTLAGNLMAGITALSFSSFLVLLRRYPHISKTGAIMCGGAAGALYACFLGPQPFSLALENYCWLALLGVVVLPVSVWLLSIGTRYITAAEVGLLMTGESILGSFWVYLIFYEVPSVMTLTGGAIILATLIIHSLLGIYKTSQG